MKKLICLSFIILLSSCASNTPYSTFRKDNKEDIAFSIGLSSFLVNSFISDKDFKDLTKHVSGIRKYRVLVSKENSTYFKKNFTIFLKNNDLDEIFHITNKNDKVHVYSYQKGGKLKEIIFKIEDEKEIVVLSVEGNLKINDIQDLIVYNE